MKTMNKDARGFVDGIVAYLQQRGKTPSTVPKVQTLLQKVSSQARKEKEAQVESSVVLTDSERQQLEQILVGLLGHEIHVVGSVTPTLIGGLRIQVGDWIVDTSLKGQLEAMASLLI